MVSTEPEADEYEENGDALPAADRPRGILTSSDRDWLAGRKDFESRGGLSKARSRVRDRLLNATHDYQYLLNLDPEQRRETFELEKEGTAIYRPYALDDELGESVADAVAFYIRTADDAEFPSEQLLEAAFVEAYPEVEEANVAIDLRDGKGDVIRTFHTEDGQIVHQETAPGALELGAGAESEPTDEAEHTETKTFFENPYGYLSSGVKQKLDVIYNLLFFMYFGVFTWAYYSQNGLVETVAVLTLIGAVIWIIDQISTWLAGLSEKENATALDGILALVRGEDSDGDAATDGGEGTDKHAGEAV